MVYEDPIVKEVREIRRRHSEKHGFDIERICKALKEREKRSTRPLVQPPVRPEADAASR